jgi:hypothetical protein
MSDVLDHELTTPESQASPTVRICDSERPGAAKLNWFSVFFSCHSKDQIRRYVADPKTESIFRR